MKHLTTLPAHMCATIVTSISPSEPAEQTHKKPSNYIFCSNLSRWSRVIYFPLNRPSAFTIKKKKKGRKKGKGEKAEGIVIHPRVQRPGRQFLSLTGRFISRSRVNSNVTQDIIDERWRAEVTCLSRTRSVRIVSRIRYHFHGSSWASQGTERFHSGIQYSSCASPSGMSRLARWTSRKTRRGTLENEQGWKKEECRWNTAASSEIDSQKCCMEIVTLEINLKDPYISNELFNDFFRLDRWNMHNALFSGIVSWLYNNGLSRVFNTMEVRRRYNL